MAPYIIFEARNPRDIGYKLFNVNFYCDTIQTMVTSDPDMVTHWIDQIHKIHRRRLRHLIVGFDVEWRPSFSGGNENPVAVLQLCVGHRCLIFQILYTPFIPNSLVEFLANESYTFVGVGIWRHANKLYEDYNLRVENVVNLRRVVADIYGLKRNAGLKELCGFALGKEIDKPGRITAGNWDNEVLEWDQIRYASTDAFINFEIGRLYAAYFP